MEDMVTRWAQDSAGAAPRASIATGLSAKVLSAKRKPPGLPANPIERRLLMEQLAEWRAHRLTVITAPAGYGKSTLAAQCVHELAGGPGGPGGGASARLKDGSPRLKEVADACRVAWLALDADDDDSAQFLVCLAAALATLIPASAAAAAAAINQNHLSAALHSLLVGLEQAAVPLLIVLDDFHHIRTPAVQQLVASAIERSPTTCHWMALTRHAAPARLIGKLRVQGQLLELNVDALRLSPAEIGALVARFGDISLDAAAIDLLAERTEGWIAVVHLALLSLNRTGGATLRTAQDVIGHLRGGNRLLAEYLTAEVLTRLPDGLHDFLLRCSILERLHPDLCRAVTGQEESAFLLEQAMVEQLFIRALSVEEEWYELHQLFRDLLLRNLRLQLSPAQLQALYRTAADWHLSRGDMAQALRYLIAGGAAELAAALLANHSRSALLSNRQAELRHWFSLLPATALESHPQLLLDRAWLGMISAVDEFAAGLARADAAITALATPLVAWVDELAVLRLWERALGASQAGLYGDALATVECLAPESQLARGWCWLAATLARSTQPTDAPVAAHAQAAAAAFAAAGCDVGSLLVTGWQAEHYAAVGDAQAALAVCKRAHQLILSQPYPALHEREYFDFLAGEIYYWLDRPQEAVACLQRALSNAQAHHDALPILRADACLHMCEVALGRSVTLTEADRAEEAALWQDNAQPYAIGFRSQVVLWQIQRWLALGQPMEAWEAYQRLGLSPATLSADAPDALALAVLLANVALGRDLAALSPHLERLLARSEQGNLRLAAIRVRLLWAHQQQQLGFHNRARTILRQALHDIESTGFVRLLFDYPALLPTLRAVDTQYARSLVARMDTPRPVSLAANLTAQELNILAHLVNGDKIAEIAERLVVSQGTVKWHLTNLYAKLGVKNQREAVALAVRLRLIAR